MVSVETGFLKRNSGLMVMGISVCILPYGFGLDV